ncbi:hypothetical protein BCR35DRAFT_309767 [Leucosporidium creatinivorum]|uniref:Uncharacterized protein n=1 Tax=Leucosporidium creatinivorum TaxID=106004 RepID=A0A1Y2DCF5_9BASI|nr:hypothetical protein BCR35DRAFT_309767 [Leucosporidium creatinivorum]
MAPPKRPSKPTRQLPPLSLLLLSLSLSFTLYLFYFLSHRTTTPTLPIPSKLAFLRPIASILDSGSDARAASSPSEHKQEIGSGGWSAPLRQRLLKKRAAILSSSQPDKPPSIPITDSLPSVLSLSPSLLRTWDDTFNSLSSHAQLLSSTALKSAKLQGRLNGIPGTGIESEDEARALQEHLDCWTGKGEWVRDEKGDARGGKGVLVHKQESVYAGCERRFYKGREASAETSGAEWDVRESLKWRWVPSASCSSTAPPSSPPSSSHTLSRHRFCTLLAHKSTLLVGDTPQYSLHDLFLDFTSVKPQSCYGDLYCREHALCGDVLRAGEDGDGALQEVENWEDDERVFNRLPLPPSAATLEKRAFNLTNTDSSLPSSDSKAEPHRRALAKSSRSPSYGTLLRYRRSDGLRPSTAHTSPSYIHPSTGIREINQQWLADSRRSDLVILAKGPLPWPERGIDAKWDSKYGKKEGESAEKQAERMIKAAEEITMKVWLPEVVETLKAVRGPPSPVDQLVVYRGGWRVQPDCGASSLPSTSFSSGAESDSPPSPPTSPGDGPPPHARQPSLHSILFRGALPSSSSASPLRLTDPFSLFHNLQTILQNHLLRTVILPEWGVPYLDLETPLSVWRSGMVGGSASAPFSSSSGAGAGLVDQSAAGVGEQAYGTGLGVGLRSAASGDCLRYCLPSPGGAVEEAFLGGLLRIFERGWASTRERRETWVGDGFENLKERTGSS